MLTFSAYLCHSRSRGEGGRREQQWEEEEEIEKETAVLHWG